MLGTCGPLRLGEELVGGGTGYVVPFSGWGYWVHVVPFID